VKNISGDVVPVDELVVYPKLLDEGLELRLELESSIVALAEVGVVDVGRVDRLAIHCDLVSLVIFWEWFNASAVSSCRYEGAGGQKLQIGGEGKQEVMTA
jgi:hypothetical protein